MATVTEVVVAPAPAPPVLRLRSGGAAAGQRRVTWTADTVEINEYSGKKKSKSAPSFPTCCPFSFAPTPIARRVCLPALPSA
jgi:hypothetical protein